MSWNIYVKILKTYTKIERARIYNFIPQIEKKIQVILMDQIKRR